ncbi:MAG: 6-phospho 3-hexuloisomerase [Firmicutes bacterium]|nr:6-phospho 3-hexuloisomerase [Bacillota bacterium]
MDTGKKILGEIEQVIAQIEEERISQAAHYLLKAKRIFVIGEGRSGFMVKAFAMRLMHLGAQSYVLGETITPAIAPQDVLVAISGSGKTHSVVWTAEKAKQTGVIVLALTANAESQLAKTADTCLVIPAATKFRNEGKSESIQPLGSLFDQSAHIVFDSICLFYAELGKVSAEAAFRAHSNLEV